MRWKKFLTLNKKTWPKQDDKVFIKTINNNTYVTKFSIGIIRYPIFAIILSLDENNKNDRWTLNNEYIDDHMVKSWAICKLKDEYKDLFECEL